MDIDHGIGRRLLRRRRQFGMTQQDLARVCGVTFQQIQKYECGATRISAARLWAAAQALDVPMDYFFDGLPGSGEITPVEAPRSFAPPHPGADF